MDHEEQKFHDGYLGISLRFSTVTLYLCSQVIVKKASQMYNLCRFHLVLLKITQNHFISI